MAASPETVLVYAIWNRNPAQGGPAVLVGHNGEFVGEKLEHAREQQRIYKTPAIQTATDAMTELDSRIQTDPKLKGMQYDPNCVQEKHDSKGDYFTFRLLRAKKELTFPKGGIEKGEKPEEAAVREFEEETSVAVDKTRLVPVQSPPDVTVFKVTLTDKEANQATAQPGKIHRDLFMPHWIAIDGLIPTMFNPQSKSALSEEQPKAGGSRIKRIGRNKLDTRKRRRHGRGRKTRRSP